MRPIKFRGKRKDNGEWVDGYYVQRSHKDCCVYHYIYTGSYFEDEEREGTELESYEVIPKTVGQYTGHKDCKRTEEYPEGQEIYKGDITKSLMDFDYADPHNEAKKKYRIREVKHGCPCSVHPSGIYVIAGIHQIEVVGNIHWGGGE